jgi:hypothetical protein
VDFRHRPLRAFSPLQLAMPCRNALPDKQGHFWKGVPMCGLPACGVRIIYLV